MHIQSRPGRRGETPGIDDHCVFEIDGAGPRAIAEPISSDDFGEGLLGDSSEDFGHNLVEIEPIETLSVLVLPADAPIRA